jgi:hypothetical protein
LKDMGEFKLDKDIQAFMVDEAPYMTQRGQSIFSLVLYQGNNMMSDGSISVDSNLNVTTSLMLDLRKVYHVRLALHYDLCGISPLAQQRMQNHCEAARKIIDALDGRIKFRPGLPICTANDVMSRQDYMKMNALINARTSRGGQGNSYKGLNFDTVATLFVDAQRGGNLSDTEALLQLEQRRRLMECLAARSLYPNPELVKIQAQQELEEEISSAEDVLSTGEHYERPSTGEYSPGDWESTSEAESTGVWWNF